MKTLALEERPNSDTQFLPYNPDLMQIKVILWKKNIIDEFPSLIDYIETQSQKLRVSRTMLLKELISLIERKLGILSAVILRRTPMSTE